MIIDTYIYIISFLNKLKKQAGLKLKIIIHMFAY